jgi:prolyl-tRNA synthetase
MKGVPLRIEIGPRDLKSNNCEFVRRDNSRRMHIPLNDVVPEVKRTLEGIQGDIHEAAKETLHANIYKTKSEDKMEMEELRRKAEYGIVSLFLCDRERCGQELEDQLGVSVLGEAVAVYETEEEEGEEEKSEGECVICSRKAKRVYVARAY